MARKTADTAIGVVPPPPTGEALKKQRHTEAVMLWALRRLYRSRKTRIWGMRAIVDHIENQEQAEWEAEQAEYEMWRDYYDSQRGIET